MALQLRVVGCLPEICLPTLTVNKVSSTASKFSLLPITLKSTFSGTQGTLYKQERFSDLSL